MHRWFMVLVIGVLVPGLRAIEDPRVETKLILYNKERDIVSKATIT